VNQAKFIDALITDPPYNSGGFSMSAVRAATSEKYCKGGGERFDGDAIISRFPTGISLESREIDEYR
jgi:hypothetical protein